MPRDLAISRLGIPSPPRPGVSPCPEPPAGSPALRPPAPATRPRPAPRAGAAAPGPRRGRAWSLPEGHAEPSVEPPGPWGSRGGPRRAPWREAPAQPLAKPLVHIRQLRGQVAHGAAAHTVALPLGLQDAIEEAVDPVERRAARIGEARLEGPFDEPPDDPLENRVPELLLALEVVVKVALADPALPQDVVEGRAAVPAHMHEPGGGVQDLLPGGFFSSH